ncbi:MAG: hypothetical protein IJC83_02240, partial [Oscillospiraceae bacterium]|nr:hypothetical protein [Oscillospiraceae bacterium]
MKKLLLLSLMILCVMMSACTSANETPSSSEDISSSSEVLENSSSEVVAEGDTLTYPPIENTDEGSSSEDVSSSSEVLESSSSEAFATSSSEEVAVSSSSTTSTSTPDSNGIIFIEGLEEKIIALVNAERAKNGLPAYETHPKLFDVAKLRTTEIIVNDYFYHQRPNGKSFLTAFGQVGAPFMSQGENIAQLKGDKTVFVEQINNAEYWFNLWKNSPSHYENILYTHYSHIGVKVG